MLLGAAALFLNLFDKGTSSSESLLLISASCAGSVAPLQIKFCRPQNLAKCCPLRSLLTPCRYAFLQQLESSCKPQRVNNAHLFTGFQTLGDAVYCQAQSLVK